jgi:acetyl-CoA carboxylase biotin carboxylase subunit
MGIRTVVVTSTVDRKLAWLDEVDEVVTIGPAAASASYLDADAIIEVARHTGCSAIHPGWGFLSENAQFAVRCAAAGLTFVGPDPYHMRVMGDKSLARATMAAAGLPPIPGSKEVLRSVEHAHVVAEQVGYPVLLKAVSGGGGRGMRAVDDASQLKEAFDEATAESTASFADGRLYMERRIINGRHVEVQIIADNYGAVIHLGERECSLQRRHQKVLEEAPSPGLTPEMRETILPRVVEAVRHVGYRSAGTMELLVDESGEAWFMEMNTRLQVEHPVTEAITGIDLVELQLRVAAGEPLGFTQEDVRIQGHAIECRINAEDPSNNFAPSPGLVTRLLLPDTEGCRVDTHLREGDRISPHYDSMVAKIIVHGEDRNDAIEKMAVALQGTSVVGVKTNVALHAEIMQWPIFQSGRYHTTSLEQMLKGDD